VSRPRRRIHRGARAAACGAPAAALLAALALGAGCHYAVPAEPASDDFDFETDRFAFANETVWHYEDGKLQPAPGPEERAAKAAKRKGRKYTRRCFVMSRSALQFWKFARFKPEAPALDKEKLAQRIHAVRRHSASAPPLPRERRVILPGYANVHALSAAHPNVFKNSLGSGWATYFRPGNVALVFPASATHQNRLHEALSHTVQKGYPFALWLANFPSLSPNHVVVVYEKIEVEENGVHRYKVYDPNDAETPKTLTYHPEAREFRFQQTFYFVGGPVTARAVYQRRRLSAPNAPTP
jgi:hypothetical protein